MPPRDTARYWLARFAIGIALLVLAGIGALGPLLGRFRPAAVLLGFYGFYVAWSSITPLVRVLTLHSRMRTAWTEQAQETFARATLPRRIFYLLTSIAAADGPISAAERDAVRHFLLERFSDPVQADELRAYEAQPLEVTDRTGLAARIATGLDAAEADTLFCWCCLVAFADGRYREHEHEALQQVSRGLGLGAARSRMLFHLARAQYLRGQKHGEPTRPGEALDVRAQALATLGLPNDATPDHIRRRHRELVRRFHPDAQPNLGPVALREATERFTAIQRAYETLTA